MRPTTGAEIQRAYGAVNYALSLGVPLVVAEDSEEKPEIAARVAWAGAGINLGSGRPSASQIRAAVRAVLTKPQYRQRAQALRTAFARHNAPDEIAELVEDLAAGGTAANSHGTRLVSACRTTDGEGQSGL
jgi:UDP:flavonoid glycosyltransferase YjiC (YdhE family)